VHVAELSARLRRRGWTVAVAGPAGVMAGVGAQDATVPVPAGWNPIAVRGARRALRPLVARPAAVLHAHGLKAAAVAFTIRRRPPVVLTIHNLVVGTHAGLRARALRTFESAIIRRADHVITISDEIDGRVAEILAPSRRSLVLPVAPVRSVTRPAVDVRADHGVGAQAPLVVVVARLHPQKDLGTFLRAVAATREQVPDVRALVVGDGPERDALRAERDALDLTDVVVFTGHRPNAVDEMHAADVVALSSRWEGSPLVVAECLTLGRPLASTAVGTVTRHLVDGVSARIVPVGDACALATAMIDLLTDRDLAERIGRAGHRVGQDVFDAERLVDGVERVYEQVSR